MLACVASVFVGLGSKERPRNGILRARNWDESQNKKKNIHARNEKQWGLVKQLYR